MELNASCHICIWNETQAFCTATSFKLPSINRLFSRLVSVFAFYGEGHMKQTSCQQVALIFVMARSQSPEP